LPQRPSPPNRLRQQQQQQQQQQVHQTSGALPSGEVGTTRRVAHVSVNRGMGVLPSLFMLQFQGLRTQRGHRLHQVSSDLHSRALLLLLLAGGVCISKILLS
jgi:hypothetical protein